MYNLTKKPICSVRWFASVPSSTQPNRLFVHSGTSAGATSNIPALLVKGYPQRTIFENLDDARISWGIYYQNIPATLFQRNLRKLKYITKFHPYGTSFKNHAKQGKPCYTFNYGCEKATTPSTIILPFTPFNFPFACVFHSFCDMFFFLKKIIIVLVTV